MNDKESRLLGECAYLLNRIFDRCEELDMPKMVGMILSIDPDKYHTEHDLYYNYFEFLDFIRIRMRSISPDEKFNVVQRVNEEGYSILNYDHSIYLWAREKGLRDYMAPSYITIPKEKLTEAEIKSFENKVKECA